MRAVEECKCAFSFPFGGVARQVSSRSGAHGRVNLAITKKRVLDMFKSSFDFPFLDLGIVGHFAKTFHFTLVPISKLRGWDVLSISVPSEYE